jgi:hypothetical protein
MVVGDIGDLRAAAAWIGDSSLKVVAGAYLKQRAGDVEAGRLAIEGMERVPKTNGNTNGALDEPRGSALSE